MEVKLKSIVIIVAIHDSLDHLLGSGKQFSAFVGIIKNRMSYPTRIRGSGTVERFQKRIDFKSVFESKVIG